jgi:peptidoglycan/xylan/chitin deacetylase (PgdA/CDA1 family)
MDSKHTISSAKWLLLLLVSVVMIIFGMMGFNVATDPFGVFGDRFFQWWSYNETNNPRVAKIGYLQQHHEEYDSYLLGCSTSGAIPVALLDEYLDARFYSMLMYGPDMLDLEQTADYLLDHYQVKNMVLCVELQNGANYNTESDPLTGNMNYLVDGNAPIPFYQKYLFANPAYGWAKLVNLREDSYIPKSFDVFDEATGNYDKRQRDAQPIGDLSDYLSQHPEFAPAETGKTYMNEIDHCMKSLSQIKGRCDEEGVNLIVLVCPVYSGQLATYDPGELNQFFTALAQVTPYWDFSISSVSDEPRYFYDRDHFQNAVGRMALAHIFDDNTVYRPEDFGAYVTIDTVEEHLRQLWARRSAELQAYTTEVPILMYHHLVEDVGEVNDASITVQTFEAQMATLSRAGYHTVSFSQLYDYVYYGRDLPEKPLVITFDDGYQSNEYLAWPILERYQMQATIFTIGVSLGKDRYKESEQPMPLHFSLEEGRRMEESGLISIQSHGYDVHEVAGRDKEPIRNGVLPRASESEEDYISFFRADCRTMNDLFEAYLGKRVSVFAYPYGLHADLSEMLLHEAGVYATVTTVGKVNTVMKGQPRSLLQMGRFNITEDLSGAALLNLMNGTASNEAE